MVTNEMQYWATFSIYDFKTPRFRQALVLFDKVVIPLPDAPIKGTGGEITNEDLDRLWAEVEYLEEAGAAIGVQWNRNAFEQWREAQSAEALAQLLDRDRQLATRLQVQQDLEKALEAKHIITASGVDFVPVSEATVVPVYAQLADYQSTLRESMADVQVLEIVAAELPMPEDNEALESIVRLRERASFKAFMPAFRKWQEEVAIRLLQAGDDEVIRKREVRRATLELRDAIAKFRRAVEEANFERFRKGITLPLVVGAAFTGHVHALIATAAEAGPEVFNVRDLVQPWWRPLADKECALAGVICEAISR